MARDKRAKIRLSRGLLRGRFVYFTEQADLRPTPSRVRDAVFSMLAEYAEQGMGFIDAFSGSGVMGFAAYSSGFDPVHMLEMNQASVKELEGNRDDLDAAVRVQKMNAMQVHAYLKPGQWVFYADPPYREKKAHIKLMRKLAANEAFLPGSIYVAEHEKAFDVDETLWQAVKDKRYGRTFISMWERTEAQPELE